MSADLRSICTKEIKLLYVTKRIGTALLNHQPMDYFGRLCVHTLYGIQKKGMMERPHCESRPKMHGLFPCTDEKLHPTKSGLLLQSDTYQIQKLTLVT